MSARGRRRRRRDAEPRSSTCVTARQTNDLMIAMPERPATQATLEALIERFEQTYEQNYGKGSAFREAGIELTNVRVEALRPRPASRAQTFMRRAPRQLPSVSEDLRAGRQRLDEGGRLQLARSAEEFRPSRGPRSSSIPKPRSSSPPRRSRGWTRTTTSRSNSGETHDDGRQHADIDPDHLRGRPQQAAGHHRGAGDHAEVRFRFARRDRGHRLQQRPLSDRRLDRHDGSAGDLPHRHDVERHSLDYREFLRKSRRSARGTCSSSTTPIEARSTSPTFRSSRPSFTKASMSPGPAPARISSTWAA